MSESDDESVFNYLFPEGTKVDKGKKGSKAIVGKNELSEKLYNLKKEEKKKKSVAGQSIKSVKSNKSAKSETGS